MSPSTRSLDHPLVLGREMGEAREVEGWVGGEGRGGRGAGGVEAMSVEEWVTGHITRQSWLGQHDTSHTELMSWEMAVCVCVCVCVCVSVVVASS